MFRKSTKTHELKARLLKMLRERSVLHGDFVLASGAHSTYYVDCKLTTFHPEGAVLAGAVMYEMICQFSKEHGIKIDAVGGLTMGADPLALAIGIQSLQSEEGPPLNVFSVRKSPKTHGQHKLIEGNFHSGDHVVVIDDVVTRGQSTLKAIEAVLHAGGHIDVVAMLVDREEGGSEAIRQKGYRVLSVFSRNELRSEDASAIPQPAYAAA